VEQRSGNLVAYGKGLEAGQAGVVQVADLPLCVAGQKDGAVLIHNAFVVRAAIHDINTHALLLITVDAQRGGQVDQARKVVVRYLFGAKVELAEQVAVFPVRRG